MATNKKDTCMYKGVRYDMSCTAVCQFKIYVSP